MEISGYKLIFLLTRGSACPANKKHRLSTLTLPSQPFRFKAARKSGMSKYVFWFVGLCLFAALIPSEVQAFDQPPWDTGHETIQPDPGPQDTAPGPGG